MSGRAAGPRGKKRKVAPSLSTDEKATFKYSATPPPVITDFTQFSTPALSESLPNVAETVQKLLKKTKTKGYYPRGVSPPPFPKPSSNMVLNRIDWTHPAWDDLCDFLSSGRMLRRGQWSGVPLPSTEREEACRHIVKHGEKKVEKDENVVGDAASQTLSFEVEEHEFLSRGRKSREAELGQADTDDFSSSGSRALTPLTPLDSSPVLPLSHPAVASARPSSPSPQSSMIIIPSSQSFERSFLDISADAAVGPCPPEERNDDVAKPRRIPMTGSMVERKLRRAFMYPSQGPLPTDPQEVVLAATSTSGSPPPRKRKISVPSGTFPNEMSHSVAEDDMTPRMSASPVKIGPPSKKKRKLVSPGGDSRQTEPTHQDTISVIDAIPRPAAQPLPPSPTIPTTPPRHANFKIGPPTSRKKKKAGKEPIPNMDVLMQDELSHRQSSVRLSPTRGNHAPESTAPTQQNFVDSEEDSQYPLPLPPPPPSDRLQRIWARGAPPPKTIASSTPPTQLHVDSSGPGSGLQQNRLLHSSRSFMTDSQGEDMLAPFYGPSAMTVAPNSQRSIVASQYLSQSSSRHTRLARRSPEQQLLTSLNTPSPQAETQRSAIAPLISPSTQLSWHDSSIDASTPMNRRSSRPERGSSFLDQSQFGVLPPEHQPEGISEEWNNFELPEVASIEPPVTIAPSWTPLPHSPEKGRGSSQAQRNSNDDDEAEEEVDELDPSSTPTKPVLSKVDIPAYRQLRSLKLPIPRAPTWTGSGSETQPTQVLWPQEESRSYEDLNRHKRSFYRKVMDQAEPHRPPSDLSAMPDFSFRHKESGSRSGTSAASQRNEVMGQHDRVDWQGKSTTKSPIPSTSKMPVTPTTPKMKVLARQTSSSFNLSKDQPLGTATPRKTTTSPSSLRDLAKSISPGKGQEEGGLKGLERSWDGFGLRGASDSSPRLSTESEFDFQLSRVPGPFFFTPPPDISSALTQIKLGGSPLKPVGDKEEELLVRSQKIQTSDFVRPPGPLKHSKKDVSGDLNTQSRRFSPVDGFLGLPPSVSPEDPHPPTLRSRRRQGSESFFPSSQYPATHDITFGLAGTYDSQDLGEIDENAFDAVRDLVAGDLNGFM